MKKPLLHTLLINKDGASAVEFALISPVVVLMMMGTIEMSVMMLAQNLMESATFSASRTGKTGYAAEGETREETIMQQLNNIAGTVLNTDKIVITSKSYNEFGDVGQPEPFIDANGNGIHDVGENYTDKNGNGQYDQDMGVSGEGNSGEVVVYTVTYPWHFVTPLVGTLLGNQQGVLNLTARTVVKNEPY